MAKQDSTLLITSNPYSNVCSHKVAGRDNARGRFLLYTDVGVVGAFEVTH